MPAKATGRASDPAVVDPLDAGGIDELVGEYGEVAGVASSRTTTPVARTSSPSATACR